MTLVDNKFSFTSLQIYGNTDMADLHL